MGTNQGCCSVHLWIIKRWTSMLFNWHAYGSVVHFLITQRWAPRLHCPAHLYKDAHKGCSNVTWLLNFRRFRLILLVLKGGHQGSTWLLSFRRLGVDTKYRIRPPLYFPKMDSNSPVDLKPLWMSGVWISKGKNTWRLCCRLIWVHLATSPPC